MQVRITNYGLDVALAFLIGIVFGFVLGYLTWALSA